MRILVCAHDAPLEPFDGFTGPVATLVRLLRSSNEVRVLAVRAPDRRGDAPTWMRTVAGSRKSTSAKAARALRAAFAGRPRGVDELAALLAEPLSQELASFRPDLVHVTSGRLAGLADVVHGRPSVLAAFDALHLNAAARSASGDRLRTRLASREATRWRRFEAAAWGRFDVVTVVSAEDASALRELDPSMPVRVIAAGVDAARFARDPATTRTPGQIVFHGVMDYGPNIAAARFLAREVFPLVLGQRPGARLVIAGRDPAPEVLALAGNRVTVTGAVAKVRDVLSRASIYVCPMRSGTGVKNKMLEAMANGLPCVATALATRGLAPSAVRHVRIGEDARALARHVVELVDDDATATAVGEAGRDAVVTEHDWRNVVRSYEALYHDVIDRALVPSDPRP